VTGLKLVSKDLIMNTQELALSPEQFIFASDDTLKTTSLKIAEKFGKQHKNVLVVIDKIH
jgi:phage regulator Rha-like protein